MAHNEEMHPVGSKILFEDDQVRIWEPRSSPARRCRSTSTTWTT